MIRDPAFLALLIVLALVIAAFVGHGYGFDDFRMLRAVIDG